MPNDYSNLGWYTSSPSEDYTNKEWSWGNPEWLTTGATSNAGKDWNTGPGYMGQNLTLRDRWDANPLEENEFRLGPYSLIMPPDSISVDQYYAPINMSSPSIRQPNSAKMASGRLLQSVTLSFIFPHQGDKEELGECTLLDFIVLFKGMPFCPVKRRLRN
jgi:hypothetical protein